MSYNQKEHKLAEKKLQKRRSIKKRLIIGLSALAMLAGAACYIIFLSHNAKLPTSNADGVSENQSVYEAQKLANSGDSEAAGEAYNAAVEESDDPVEKSAIILSKANLYYNNGDYDGALVVALEAESVDKSSLVEQYIAQIYEQKKDLVNAKKYYQSAIDLIDTSDISAGADVQYYQSRIDSLNEATN